MAHETASLHEVGPKLQEVPPKLHEVGPKFHGVPPKLREVAPKLHLIGGAKRGERPAEQSANQVTLC